MYLLDANVLIDANRDYYAIIRVPEFWEWLVHVGEQDLVKIPLEIFEEIKVGDDDLGKWARKDVVKAALLLNEDAEVALVSRVTEDGYAKDLTDDEIEKIGRDPFLIAYSLANGGKRTIVTTEASKPRRQRANRQVPNVCDDFGISWCNTFKFVRDLDFRTDWKTV